MSMNSEVHAPATLRWPVAEPDFRALFDALPDYIAVLDHQWRVVAISDGYLAAMDRSRFEVVGQRAPAALNLHVTARRSLEAALRAVFADGHEHKLHIDGRWLQSQSTGGPGAFDIVHTAMSHTGSQPRFVVQRVADVTEFAALRRAKDDACAAEARKMAFFTNISHELRTPLALILGPTETLRETTLNRRQQHDVEVIARNARTLAARVDDLLDVAKLEAGKVGLRYTHTDIAQVLRLAASHFDHRAAAQHIDFHIEAPATQPGDVDVEKLQRAILNLLANAFEATPDGGKICVSLSRTDNPDWLSVAVADSGPGISEAMHERVMQRFGQVPKGDGAASQGTGLGLSITRELLQLHGGEVRIGASPSGGALVTLSWPRHAPQGTVVHRSTLAEALTTQPNLARALPQPIVGQPLVLLVEDNVDMAHFITHVLTPEYRVICVSDAATALRRAKVIRPDLILSDMNVPRRHRATAVASRHSGAQPVDPPEHAGGEALLTAVRNTPQLDTVSVVFLTARADDTLRARMLRAGAQDYIVKPFYADELRSRLSTLIGVDRARQLLQAEAASGAHDLEVLAAEVASQRRRAAFLADVSRHLADSLDYDTTLQRISRLALPTLADICIIDVVDAHRRIKRVQVAHVCPEKEMQAQELMGHPPSWDDLQPSAQVLRSGRSLMTEVLTDALVARAHLSDECRVAVERQKIQTLLAVPMRAHGRTLGVICLGGIKPGRHFTHEDMECAEAMAERAAFALDSARLYRDAQAALASRDDFLMIAAHELRTPLTSLMLQIHTVHRRATQALQGHPDQAALEQRLQCLSKQSDRIAHLIDAMLDVACIASGHFAVNLAPVNFVEVVRDVLQQLETSGDLARSHCAVQTETPESIIGQWDRTRLEQLLHHLLANAIKYGAGQPVHIALIDKPKEVVLRVQDRGIGIDKHAQAHIFERFARAISTHNYGGLGVGLYVVRQIAEAMGGRITVESTPGGGATFTVYLPRGRSCAPAAWPAAADVFH
jgi:signal transduction histidine kinase/DNA-binding response OmpR family regulator